MEQKIIRSNSHQELPLSIESFLTLQKNLSLPPPISSSTIVQSDNSNINKPNKFCVGQIENWIDNNKDFWNRGITTNIGSKIEKTNYQKISKRRSRKIADNSSHNSTDKKIHCAQCINRLLYIKSLNAYDFHNFVKKFEDNTFESTLKNSKTNAIFIQENQKKKHCHHSNDGGTYSLNDYDELLLHDTKMGRLNPLRRIRSEDDCDESFKNFGKV